MQPRPKDRKVCMWYLYKDEDPKDFVSSEIDGNTEELVKNGCDNMPVYSLDTYKDWYVCQEHLYTVERHFRLSLCFDLVVEKAVKDACR